MQNETCVKLRVQRKYRVRVVRQGSGRFGWGVVLPVSLQQLGCCRCVWVPAFRVQVEGAGKFCWLGALLAPPPGGSASPFVGTSRWKGSWALTRCPPGSKTTRRGGPKGPRVSHRDPAATQPPCNPCWRVSLISAVAIGLVSAQICTGRSSWLVRAQRGGESLMWASFWGVRAVLKLDHDGCTTLNNLLICFT